MNYNYLLILSCSQRKRADEGLMPALKRYDGGHFRVLRKAQQADYLPHHLDILILSARYGLIEAEKPIANYQQRMTLARAEALNPQVLHLLSHYAQKTHYHELYIDLGQHYLPAVADFDNLFDNVTIVCAQGRIGERLRQLKNWFKQRKND